MIQPHYIFLTHGRFVIALTHETKDEIKLIHPFDSKQEVVLQGQFAALLKRQLSPHPLEPAAPLKIIEKQHEWLQGLSSSSLMPIQTQRMIMGDTLGLLFLEITDQCNEQCIHCYASSSPACSDFLPLDKIERVLIQARSLGQPIVQFTGGDPLIHRHLVEAVALTHELDFQGIEIYTNGLLLNDKLLQQFVPYAPSFAFSLYSPDKAVHDSITQLQGSHQKTIAAMHRAKDLGFDIRIGMAVMEQNTGHEQAMLDFANGEFGLGKGSVRFDPVHETGRGSNLNTKHISLMPSQNSHMPDSPQQKRYHQVAQQDKNVLPNENDLKYKNMRRGKLAVCANGNISPCIFNREHVLGNIHQQSLVEALAQAPNQGNHFPSVERWNFCQHNLSCADCQMVAYTLGEV